MRKARVFISCGQRERKEVAIGEAITDYFQKRGFEPYFAGRVHSSAALTESIFDALKGSEYFVFVDFRREKIGDEEYRGSLFVNQEVAIATFLRLECLGFSEPDIRREGIRQFQIFNENEFVDGTEITGQLDELTDDWDPESLDELGISIGSTTPRATLVSQPSGPLTDWYHLEIRNHSQQRHAFNVLAYVTGITDIDAGTQFRCPTNELIWAGIGHIETNIMAGTGRELDAFFIQHGGNQIKFHQRPLSTTNACYWLPELPSGCYEVEYTVVASNFANVARTFIVELEQGTDKVSFMPAKKDPTA